MHHSAINMTAIRSTLLAAMLWGLGGCESFVADRMIEAPNHGKGQRPAKASAQWVLDFHEIDGEGFVKVGPPDATLHYYRIDPDENDPLINGRPRGTLLVLHGKDIDSWWMLVKGKDLVRAGYRVVMVDSRGHGKSSGDYLTYGALESKDLVRVIDHLEKKKLIVGKLGVWGISMGGATAIQLAGRDQRIKAVVSVSPYTTMREVVPLMVRKLVPESRISDEKMQKLIDRAGKKAKFDPDDADCLTAIGKTRTPILLFSGEWDMICPIEHARRLHKAAPKHSKLIELNYTGHITAGVDLFGEVRTESIKWFNTHLVDKLTKKTGAEES